MKSFLISAIFAGAALAQVGNLNGLPDCAKSCVNLNDLGGCNQLNIKCVCSSKAFIDGISCCVAKACPNKTDQDNTIKFARGICEPAGVTNLPTAPSCASSTAASGGSTSTSSGSSGGVTAAPTGTTASDGSGSPEATGSSAAAGSSPSAGSASPGAAAHAAAHGAAAVGGMMLAALL